MPVRLPSQHTHTSTTLHVIGQCAGIPYEVERTVCKTCGRVLAERPVRRAAA